MGEEAMATTLEHIYYFLGLSSEEDLDRIKENLKDSLPLEERLLMVNDHIIGVFSDRKQLEKGEGALKAGCRFIEKYSPDYYITCSVIKEKGVYKFLEDLRMALQDLNERNEILKKYSKFLERMRKHFI